MIGKTPGETVTVTTAPDSSPRTLTIPSDIMKALERAPEAKAKFSDMAYSHRKAYVDWIEQARRQETREKRIKRSLQMIMRGRVSNND